MRRNLGFNAGDQDADPFLEPGSPLSRPDMIPEETFSVGTLRKV